MTHSSPAMLLAAALACGLMIGIQRAWRLRDERSGSRVAGIRTFTLLGAGGGLSGLIGNQLSSYLAAVLALAFAVIIIIGFIRDSGRRDTTTFVAATLALAFGILAGAGEATLAVAGSATVTLVLASRAKSHWLIQQLSHDDVLAFARYAVIAGAVLPFLPNRHMGPLDAWNPFQLWLVVVLVTGFSFAGYIASRALGSRRGVLATALIGGAYSSTAVTASLAQRLGKGEAGPYAAGIAIASAVMYCRVIVLVAILSPSTLSAFAAAVAPAMLVAGGAALFLWMRSAAGAEQRVVAPGNPIELVPALGFAAMVAAAAVVTRWAQERFGESGTAISLFLTGSFDVDAAIVTLSGLPVEAISRDLAAIALAGTIIANMALKIAIAAVYARRHGAGAIVALGASTLVLAASLLWYMHQLELF